VKCFMRIFVVSVLLAFCALSLNGCSGGDSWRYDPGIPGQVTAVSAESGDKLVSLSWDGSPVATSYNIYYVSCLTENGVTKTNGTKINVDKTQKVITGLDNNIEYYFIVTALNRDGESIESIQVSATPRPISNADLVQTWYFHTLVTGQGAKWERGTMTVAMDANGVCNAEITAFEDSAGNTQPPAGFNMSVNGSAEVIQSGAAAWPYFHGTMGSRKNMMVATWSPSLTSRAITIFQKKRGSSDYTVDDITGTGSGQNSVDASKQGNGPTRFAYHQLYSGSNADWEYCNAKVGKKGQVWLYDYKDIIYWDYATPTYKGLSYDYFYKVTSIGVDQDGVVTEYWNYVNVADPVVSPAFNYLVPKQPHDIVFTGRMTADKTIVVGVSTRTDVYGANPQYFLRIIELCFKPTDQADLVKPSLNDLAGNYKFHKLVSPLSVNGSSGAALWAYGNMSIDISGLTILTESADSAGNTPLTDTFTLSYYPDPNPDSKSYKDFANFVTSAQDGKSHYYDANGKPFHNYYDFASYPSDINKPSTWRLEDISPYYYNEHGTLSFNGDLFVLTRTESSGNCLIIGLK
jgi:hypothetical protein